MPGRVARSSLSNKVPTASKKANQKSKKRNLNAFAIAQHQAPDTTKIKQHRLGVTEDEGPQRKKQRRARGSDGEDEDEPSDATRMQRKNVRKGAADDLDVESGSDSEGHEWRLGAVGNDDDSDLDSEEAFGESDEERFEGFAFRGSSKSKKPPKSKKVFGRELDLDEDDTMEAEETDDDLGEDAIDLAAALDESQDDSDDEELNQLEVTTEARGSDSMPRGRMDQVDSGVEFEYSKDHEADTSDEFGGSSDFDDGGSDFSISDAANDDNNPEKLKQLQSVVSSLRRNRTSVTDDTKIESEDSTTAATRMLNALKSMPGVDPELMKSVKKLSGDRGTSKTIKSNHVVKVPLPKRQQDRIDRSVAYEKAKETLNRWIDTVKHNRRAEHLSFPLQDPHAQEAQGTTKFQPTTAAKPRTELESTINEIMQASGLVVYGGKSEEDQIQGFEELESNKMTVEEVAARRAELRKARDLLFREEVRAKRIKKIKSKSFRRVHRKDAQREAQKEKNLLAAAGLELSEDEKEANDKRRAEERMGARHRESKWGKNMKQTGRAVWDEEARDGVADMARRNEDLRKRMEGKRVGNEDEEDTSESDDDESQESEDLDGGFKLREQLDEITSAPHEQDVSSKLGGLKFMQRADARRKQQNDEDAERLRRELDDEDSPSEPEAEVNVGRRIFGPTESKAQNVAPAKRSEFEEVELSDSEDAKVPTHATGPEFQSKIVEKGAASKQPQEKQSRKQRLQPPPAKAKAFLPGEDRSAEYAGAKDEIIETTRAKSTLGSAERTAPVSTIGWKTVHHPNAEAVPGKGDVSGDEDADETFFPSNLELVRSAFGGADVEAAFAAEKDDAAASEDEKTVNNALPGWGSWAGEGVSKRELKRAGQRTKDRFVTKVADGVRPSDRKDKKLKDVIISERRVKKNAKYLAENLPHPFESRQQYERSLRLPIGPEWTTKETFQSATKPRVLVKAGRVIAPMHQPMV